MSVRCEVPQSCHRPAGLPWWRGDRPAVLDRDRVTRGRYSLQRRGSGEPLVLLHGGAGTWRLWEPVIPLLEPHHDVLALTLAGHWGGAPLPVGGPAGIEALVERAESDMEAEGVHAAHIAGGSLGGWVALELARRGRAKSVVAIAPAGSIRGAAPCEEPLRVRQPPPPASPAPVAPLRPSRTDPAQLLRSRHSGCRSLPGIRLRHRLEPRARRSARLG